MSWQKWVLAAVLALGALTSVATVGRRRKALTSTDAVIIVILDAALIALVVTS